MKIERGLEDRIERGLIRLQRAVTPDEVWAGCVKLLRGALPVYNILLGLPSLGITPLFMRATKPIPNLVRFAELAPLNDAIQARPGTPVARMSDHYDAASPKGQAFLKEFLIPMGWRYGAAMLFWNEEGRFLGQLAAIRTETQGDFTENEMELLQELRHHVESVVERLLRLEQQLAAHVSLEHSITALPLPIVIANWDGKVGFSNPAGREALAAWKNTGSTLTRAFKPTVKLPPEISSACANLRNSWENATCVDDSERVVRRISVPHRSVPGFSAEIQLVESRGGRSLQPSFSMHFQLPPAEKTDSARALASLSRLTSAEREVARRAAEGESNADISQRLGISLSTVRTHLRHVFEKLAIGNRARLAPMFHVLTGQTPSSKS